MRRLGKIALAALSVGAATLLAASASLAENAPIGTGTYVSSGSKVTSAIYTPFVGEDIDNYVFDGYAGQTVSISVAAAKGSTLLPVADLFRPDGTAVSQADGAKMKPKQPAAPGKSSKIAFKLDQTGVWTLRIRGSYPGKLVKGDNPATPEVETKFPKVEYTYLDPVSGADLRTKGAYVFTVKYKAPPASSWKNAVPDDSGAYRFFAPAAGGATISAKLTFKGGTPTFTSLTDTNGKVVSSVFTKTKTGKYVQVNPYQLSRTLPLGAFIFEFQAEDGKPSTKVNFKATVKLGSTEKPLKAALAQNEPLINAINPDEGGPNVPVNLACSYLSDGGNGKPRVFLGRIEVDPADVTPDATNANITFRTPIDLPDGVYDVKVLSTSGQAAVLPQAFTVVPPPVAIDVDPRVGSAAGGYLVTVTGSNFSVTQNGMRVGFRDVNAGSLVVTPPVTFLNPPSATSLRFTMPNLFPAGEYELSVINARTGRSGIVPFRLKLEVNAAINRVVPGLVPILGGETMYVNGANFRPTDTVWMEQTPGSGNALDETGWVELSATETTYLNPTQHRFTAPVRAKGTYRVRVKDQNGYRTPTRSFNYYQFQDFSSSLGLTGGDGFDAWTTDLGDLDKDGDLDLVLCRKGGATKSTTTQTRIFLNNGSGAFTDATSTAITSVAADDDWRADRVRVADLNGDGYPDIVIVTNSKTFPLKDAKSHVRFLVNERRSSALPISERTFRDRTSDLMAPLRAMSRLYGSGLNETDDWRGQDLWVGDLDLSNQGPPEIVITNDEVFENYYVSCTPYCASPYSSGYSYSFYWGGTRVFRWDQSARSGLGRYKFDANYFPRKSGITVPIFNPPPGVTIPTCTPGQCRGKFTPFTGQRLALGEINGDGRPDVAVLNNAMVKRDGATISSLQVAINVFHGGFQVWDVTDDFTGLAGTSYFQGYGTVAIGPTGYKDVDGFGVVAFAKTDATGLTGTQSALNLIRAKATDKPEDDPADFELINESLPAATANDRLQSSQIAFLDVDDDGDADLITVSKTPPGGNGPAFRIFRNEVQNQEAGHLTRFLDGLLATLMTPTEHFEGVALAIGDVDNDRLDSNNDGVPDRAGPPEFVITRDGTTGGSAPHTRAIRIDK